MAAGQPRGLCPQLPLAGHIPSCRRRWLWRGAAWPDQMCPHTAALHSRTGRGSLLPPLHPVSCLPPTSRRPEQPEVGGTRGHRTLAPAVMSLHCHPHGGPGPLLRGHTSRSLGTAQTPLSNLWELCPSWGMSLSSGALGTQGKPWAGISLLSAVTSDSHPTAPRIKLFQLLRAGLLLFFSGKRENKTPKLRLTRTPMVDQG